MIFSGIKPVFPPQMLDELIFVPEVVWTYLWQINFFSPEILKVPLGTGLLKSKKKICGCRRKKMCSARLLRRASVHELFMDYPTCSWTVHEHVQILVANIWIFPDSWTSFEHVHEQFMNCSWTCSKDVQESGNIQIFATRIWTCSWTVHEQVG